MALTGASGPVTPPDVVVLDYGQPAGLECVDNPRSTRIHRDQMPRGSGEEYFIRSDLVL